MVDRAGPSTASASSSLNIASKSDQVVYRVYLKTLSVLAEGRLTHYAGAVSRTGERKQDRWFNLITPDVDISKNDLRIYQNVSHFSSATATRHHADPCTIPPLLIAFVLDTSDMPNGQALLWNRGGVKIPLDTTLIGKGKGKERERGGGIVLERWTFQARTPPAQHPASSQQAAPQAYRLGIIHFRALYSLIRLLPAYRLFRRLRRANTGLKLAIKLWAPDDTPSEALPEAWDIMEQGQMGLYTGLDELAQNQAVDADQVESHEFPPLDLFGLEYHLSVQYRPDVDFHVEAMESVLSEKLGVDMEEEWFTPTMARHRMEDEARAAGLTGPHLGRGDRRPSGPAPIPGTSPIPQRQGPASIGSFRGSVGRPPSRPSLLGSSRSNTPGSLSKWGAMAEGLPFAAGPTSPTLAGPPSPSGAAITARRLSGHHVPTGTSPTTSLRAVSAQTQRPALGSSKPSSLGRTSSFLSQSGRSFTHAQLATMGQTQGIPIGSASPPIIGAMSGIGEAGNSQTSLTFSKQSVPRSHGRSPFATHQSGSPIIPGSLERDAGMVAGSPGNPSQVMKRYSSYSARRERLAGSPTTQAGSQGSSGGDGSAPGGSAQGLLRRTSTRASYESSSLRRSPGDSGGGSGTASRVPQVDQDDIEAFLKTLDALPQPPSVAAQAAHASRTHLPSTSSSLSNPSAHPPDSLQGSTEGDAGQPASPAPPPRVPLTKTQIDDALKRMAGSFNHVTASIMETGFTSPVLRSQGTSGSGTPSMGLLSASRPLSSPRKVPSPENRSRRTSSGAGVRPGLISTGSPLAREGYTREPSAPSSALPTPEREELKADDAESRRPSAERRARAAARSLPDAGVAGHKDPESRPLRSDGLSTGQPAPIAALSPQTTGGQADTTSRSRRGPVLLRGGFESRERDRDGRDRSSRRDKTSVSSSPSHSPIRDFGRLAIRDREREVIRDRAGFSERQAEEELDNWARSAPGPGPSYVGLAQVAGGAGTGGGGGTAGVLGRYRSLGLPGTTAASGGSGSAGYGDSTSTSAGAHGMHGASSGDTGTGAGRKGLAAGYGYGMAPYPSTTAQGAPTPLRHTSAGSGVGAGGRTAPSSFGAGAEEDRGRRGKVRSEGEE